MDLDLLEKILRASRVEGDYVLSTISVSVTLAPRGSDVKVSYSFKQSAPNDEIVITRDTLRELVGVIGMKYKLFPPTMRVAELLPPG